MSESLSLKVSVYPVQEITSFRDAVLRFSVNVVQWNEDCYERVLIERTKDSLDGEVDIVIDFGTTSRSLHRSLQCLSKVRPVRELHFEYDRGKSAIK